MPDERFLRYLIPPFVVVLVVILGVWADPRPSFSLPSVLARCGLTGDSASLVAPLVGGSAVFALGFVLFAVTYATIWCLSRWIFSLYRQLRRDSARWHGRDWRCFWPTDLKEQLELEDAGTGAGQTWAFDFRSESEFSGFFLESEMPEHVLNKLRKNWAFFYTNLNSAMALLCAYLFASYVLKIQPAAVSLCGWSFSPYWLIVFLFAGLLTWLGILAWWDAWRLLHFFVRRHMRLGRLNLPPLPRPKCEGNKVDCGVVQVERETPSPGIGR